MMRRVYKNMCCRRQDTHQRGFTLIELLLYVGIASLIMLTISSFLILVVNARQKHHTLSEVEQQGIQATEMLTQLIRESDDVTAPAVGATSSSLTLDMPDAADDPTVIGVTGGAIDITQGANGAVALTNSRVTISNLTFTNLSRDDDLDSIQLEFTVTYTNPSSTNPYDYEETFRTTVTNR